MGIDARETGVIIWKILGFSMNTSIKFMRNHPILSGVSMFLLVLYIFLPSLLFFLIYSSPVFACAAVYARERIGLKFAGSKTKTCGGEKSSVKCHLKQQRSVRRNARMKVEQWDLQTNEEEKDKVILTSLYNDLLGRTPQFEESPKAIDTDVVEDNEKSFVSVEDSRTRDLSNENSEEEAMVCNCELDGTKEETREEIGNVNEHGISEIETNKRLESLIARRRARRLFKLALSQHNKLQAEEATSSTQNNNNLQVTVARNKNNNLFEKHRNHSSEDIVMGVQMPGSAPSVLLQGRNPFDIPYDPQEERPNLTGDSFDEEFSLLNHQDKFFCRHESFCRFSLFSPQHAQCMNSPVAASDIAITRKRLDLDNEYMDQTEQKVPCDQKESTIEDDKRSVENGKTEVKMNEETCSNKEESDDDDDRSVEREVEMNDETDSNKEESDDDSSGSEESESEFTRLNNTELREAICHSMDNYPGFVLNQARNSIPSQLPRAVVPVAPRVDDNNMFYTRRCVNSHGRTYSIASDLQVEVSEVGSPPTTVDWLDDWSNGGESYTYDTDIDREIVRSEESRKGLSDQYESRSGIGLKEENNRSGAKLNQKCVDLSLLDSSNIQTKEDAKQVAKEIFQQKPSSTSDMFKRSNSGKFEGLLFHTSVSLTSITEEPETVLDSIDGGKLENINYLTEESPNQRSLSFMDSSMEKKLTDAEVVDVKHNDDLCGSPKMINLDMTNHQQLNNSQGKHDTEINVNKYENTEPREYVATQSFLDAFSDTPYIKSYGREMEEDDERNLENYIEEETKQAESEALLSDLESSPSHVLTKLVESEVMEENEPKLLEEKAEPIEQEETQIILTGSSSHPHTQLLEDDINIENGSNVRFLQVQQGNSSTLDTSTNLEISKEEENPGLIQDPYAELTEEHNNRTSAEEESIVSTEIQNSQDSSQSWTQKSDINCSEMISPRTLEVSQQPEHGDVIVPNTVFQDIEKDESVTLVEDSAGSKNNDEENLKLDDQIGDDMEKKLEHDLEPIHHSIGFVAKEDEESKKLVEAMHIAQVEITENENRISEERYTHDHGEEHK